MCPLEGSMGLDVERQDSGCFRAFSTATMATATPAAVAVFVPNVSSATPSVTIHNPEP